MHLATERLLFRSFTVDDLHQFAAVQADPDVMRFVGGVKSLEESKQQLLEIIRLDQDSGIARFAVELKITSRLIGYCGFKPAGEYVDLGYQYSKAAWGQGNGLEAATAIREYGLSQLGITNMEAGCSKENTASVKILQQLGFANCEELMFEGNRSIRFFD